MLNRWHQRSELLPCFSRINRLPRQNDHLKTMSLIENIIRPDIRALSAYHVPDSTGFVKLDAMENPYPLPEPLRAELGRHLPEVAMIRYPVSFYAALKA